MKKFKFIYSPLAWVLIIAVLILSVAGLIWNVVGIFNAESPDATKLISNCIFILIALFLSVLTLSVIFYGYYVVKDGKIICCFGLIRSEYKIKDIEEITHFKKSDKLVIYLSDRTYSVIVINKREYDDFVLCVREFNKEIIYDNRIDGEDSPQ